MNYLQQLPFTYKTCGKVSDEIFTFHKVEFIRDFGTYVKGDKFDNVEIDAKDGELRAYEEAYVYVDNNPRKVYAGDNQVALQSIAIIIVPVPDK